MIPLPNRSSSEQVTHVVSLSNLLFRYNFGLDSSEWGILGSDSSACCNLNMQKAEG